MCAAPGPDENGHMCGDPHGFIEPSGYCELGQPL